MGARRIRRGVQSSGTSIERGGEKRHVNGILGASHWTGAQDLANTKVAQDLSVSAEAAHN